MRDSENTESVSSEFIDTVTESYDCVVLHLFTNDVRDSENTESVSSQFIDTVTERYDCVVLHLYTNDVRDSENTESVSSEFIDTVTESYDCVVLPLFTNDVRDSENTESVSSEFELLVKKIHRKWSETKMLISMGISRGDSVKVNNKMLEYIYNIRTLSVNIKFICTSFRNRQNSEPSASFSDLFRSEYK